MSLSRLRVTVCVAAALGSLWLRPVTAVAQGVTTAALNGVVSDTAGTPIPDANILAVHVPSGTSYRGLTRSGGAFSIPNMRVGGPYRISIRAIGFEPKDQEDVFLNLGQNLRIDFTLTRQVVQIAELQVTGERDEVLNAGRTGAATFISRDQVALLPSVKRSTRDLTRLDPRSDGNLSFAGRNWLYNNISLDGSYFNNPFGLDDPAPGGQTGAEPVPYDAVDQVQVSVAPFDVRQGGFTGANVNTVTRSGTNQFQASLYTFYRNDDLQGNTVSGSPVVANPDLRYIQSGFSVGGALIRDKLFFFLNGELERTDDPGTNFVANRGTSGFGVSRVLATDLDAIRDRLIQEYDYDPGPYEDYIHKTDNNKLLAKLDWNIDESNKFTFRYNLLDAKRDLPPHPFVFSINNTGRGPNETSLPFYGSGYAINNNLNSFALELNTNKPSWANRFFASYNRFRDNRQPFSRDFPTIEIGDGSGVQYTTVGHEPFSIHNILDQDVLQLTNNFTLLRGRHNFTLGGNFEKFSFFNSFNLFRNGFFIVPPPGGTTFASVQDFLDATDPNNPDQIDLNALVGTGPFKGEDISVGQLSFYAQDEFLVSNRFTLTYGIRADFPMYFTDPVDNPFSRGLTALDENDQSEIVDQSRLPGAKLMLSPRVGFNWNAVGERSTQVRGGTGIFTGRVPFVWVGNVISNPGANPNLYPAPGAPEIPTSDDAILQQSFDLNAMDPDFKWPQIWTTDLAVDQQLPWDLLGTLEVIYSNDLQAAFVRNADLVTPVGTLPDGRPYF